MHAKMIMLTGLLAGSVAHALPKTRVLVFPVTADAVDLKDAAAVTGGLVTSEAAKTAGAEVKALKDVETLLDVEQKKQLLGCASATCASDLAGALDTDELIQGSLNKLG